METIPPSDSSLQHRAPAKDRRIIRWAMGIAPAPSADPTDQTSIDKDPHQSHPATSASNANAGLKSKPALDQLEEIDFHIRALTYKRSQLLKSTSESKNFTLDPAIHEHTTDFAGLIGPVLKFKEGTSMRHMLGEFYDGHKEQAYRSTININRQAYLETIDKLASYESNLRGQILEGDFKREANFKIQQWRTDISKHLKRTYYAQAREMECRYNRVYMRRPLDERAGELLPTQYVHRGFPDEIGISKEIKEMMRQKLDPESLLYKDLFGIGACTVGSKAPASPPEPYDLTPPRMQPPGVPPSQAAPGTNHRKDEVPGYSVAPTCLGGYGDGPHVEITQHLGRDYIYRPRDPVLVALLDEAEALEDQQAQQAKKARKALPAYKSHQSKENVNRPALQTSTQTHSDPIPTPRSNEATFSGDATTTQDSRSIYTDPLYQPSTSQAVSRTQLLRSAVRSQARERLEAREGKGNGKGVGGGISKRSHRKH